MQFSSTVPPHLAGLPLADYLAQRFTYHSREEWLAHVQAGRVLVQGSAATSLATLAAGQSVTFVVPPFEEPEADCNFRIVYEDAWLLGIDKPGNLLIHRAGKSVTRNLMYLLRNRTDGPAFPEASPVHRLDRGTSGVVIVAKTPEGRAPLQNSFALGQVDKEYLAVVQGRLPQSPVAVTQSIDKDIASGIGYRHCVSSVGKPAETGFEEVEVVGDGNSLVRARPVTGRTHQIRVHLAWLGCPCVGDVLYTLDPAAYRAWVGDPAHTASPLEFPRQALHCARVMLTHPFTGQLLTVEAPQPDDMLELMTRLRGSVSSAKSPRREMCRTSCTLRGRGEACLPGTTSC